MSSSGKAKSSTKSTPAKKAPTPTKGAKKVPTSPTKVKGKEKVNGEVKGKGKAVNGAAAGGAVPKTTSKENKSSPVEKNSPKVESTGNEEVSNGINFDAPVGDFSHLDQQEHHADIMIGDLHILFLTEIDTKYMYAKHQSAPGMPGDSTCDVTIEVDRKSFTCHRSVLTHVSKYFADKLARVKDDPFKLEDSTKADTFETILEALYNGFVILNRDVSQQVFDAGSRYDITWLKDAGADNMMRSLGPENYLAIGELFEKHGLLNLKEQTQKLVAHNLVLFSDSNEFLETLELDTLKKMLSTNEYVEGSEGFIVKVVLDWVHMGADKRKHHLLELAKLIRFPLLEPEELDRLPSELYELPQIAKRIEEAKNYGISLSSQCLRKGDEFCARGCRDVIMLISASEMNNGNLILYKDLNKLHEPICVEHLEQTGLQTEMMFTAMATLGNFLFVAGGYNRDHTTSKGMFRFDPRFRDWLELAPMSHSRASFAMCASDKNLFAVGGVERRVEEEKETETTLDSVELYAPLDNSWKALPNLPYGCSEHAITYCDGNLYISGGISSNPIHPIPLDYMNVLQVEGGEKWESLTPMFTGRQGHSISSVNGKLFVLGGKSGGGIGIQGFESCLTTEIYSPATKQWTKLSSIPDGVGSVSRFVAVLGEKVVFLAGQHWHYYDSEKNEFIEGDFCGPEVQRVASLRVAYPPTI